MKLKAGSGDKPVSNSNKLYFIMVLIAASLAVMIVGVTLTEEGYSDRWVSFECDDMQFNITSSAEGLVEVTGYEGDDTELVIPRDVSFEGFRYVVDSIGVRAFSGNKELTSVVLPSELRYIQSSAFEGCNGLTSIAIPDGVKSLGNEAFSSCRGLTEITLGSNLEFIGSWAFHRASIVSLEIPVSVSSIGGGAFCSCSQLRELSFPVSLDPVVDRNYPVFEGCTGIEKITITAGDGGAVGPGESYKLAPWNLSKDSLVELVLSEGVSTVPKNMFRDSGSENLNFRMCSSIKSIGYSAFRFFEASNEITIPSSVVSIENYAFEDCLCLSAIDLRDVVSIGDYAFKACHGLNSIVLGDALKTIGSHAFDGCNSLTHISFGLRIESIGEGAFAGIDFFEKDGSPMTVDAPSLVGGVFKGADGRMEKIMS